MLLDDEFAGWEVSEITVAALYIDPRGPYPKMPGVDCWDESRDARNYAGPWPVVAHPPCGPWGKLRHLCRRQFDAALFGHALSVVYQFGGVIEHPAGSKAWPAHGLPLPGAPCDAAGGVTVELDQVEWGHVANKPTWLYLFRVAAPESPPFPGRAPTHGLMGGRGRNANAWRGKGLKETSAEQRRRTPPLFAEYLVRLARSASKERAA